MASIYELLRALGHKGGPASGKPYMEPGKPVHQYMNLSPEQAMAPHTLHAALAARGPEASTKAALKHGGLSGVQQERRSLRSQLAAANGLDPDVAFYGAHADPRAQALLRGGSGLGRGLGGAQPEELDLAALVAQSQRRSRRRGYRLP